MENVLIDSYEIPFNFDDSYFTELDDLSKCLICSNILGRNCHETNCGHKFHPKCLKMWLISGRVRCPTCLKRISMNDRLNLKKYCDFCQVEVKRNNVCSQDVCSHCVDRLRLVSQIHVSIGFSKAALPFSLNEGPVLGQRQIEHLKLFLLRYTYVLTACKTHIDKMDFANTSSIFYLKSLRDILNIRDDNFDVERMIDFSNDMQKFLNACVKNCGWETRSDVDYWKCFDSYGNLLIEFYKAPFSTPGGLFLGEELKVLRHLLREFENNEIRRALRRFVGTIDRRILQKYTCIRALYDKFSKWDRKKVKMNKLIRKVNRVQVVLETKTAKKLYIHL
ncbi:hypothetical protein AVEN_122681-1 [Araneus ventricosus]|uniref:RING-type domain-containing protein n=1 Tax=Araneus ventricosus TaxID=182803 RepID=A0A4Y2P6J8_ARAVE|nr:hypothetical protein AVEN_122681-1 [Araneus ventricosus]